MKKKGKTNGQHRKGRSMSAGNVEQLMQFVDDQESVSRERTFTTQIDLVPFETNYDIKKQNEIQLSLQEMDKKYGHVEIEVNEDESHAKFMEDSNNEEADLQPVNVDHNQMRMKYLSRLAKQQVWLSPMKQPKVS